MQHADAVVARNNRDASLCYSGVPVHSQTASEGLALQGRAAPVPATILEGDTVAGTSLLIMDEGVDTGPIIASREIPLKGTERTPELTKALFALGAELLVEYGPRYVSGALKPTRQTDEGATLVRRHRKDDGILEWHKSAEILERQVRAYEPWPGSATRWRGSPP